MTDTATYSARERAILWTVAGLGCLGLNGPFLYGTLFQPSMIASAMSNPLAVAFIVEALVLTALLAYLLAKWNVTIMPWGWFVIAALVGSLAFAVPLAALWRQRKGAAI